MKNIFFRADGKEDILINGFKASNEDLEDSIANLDAHVRGKKSPYVSLTESILTAVFKYSYGFRIDKDIEQLIYNDFRSPIYLVNISEQNHGCIENGEVKKTTETPYYLSSEFSEGTMPGNFARADREVLVYKQVKKESIYEVHPFLADVLVALEIQIHQNAKDNDKVSSLEKVRGRILDGIIAGDFSKSNVDRILENVKVNFAENIFLKEFYGVSIGEQDDGERKLNNLVDSFKASFPNAYSGVTKEQGLTTEMKKLLVAATSLRVQVLKDVLPLFLDKDEKLAEFHKDYKNNFSQSYLDDYILPAEEFVKMSTLGDESLIQYRIAGNAQIFGVTKTKANVKASAGMNFILNDVGDVVGGEYKYYDVTSNGYDNYIYQEIMPGLPKGYVGVDLNNKYARLQREKYINCYKGIKTIREINGEYYGFDEDEYCVKLKKIEYYPEYSPYKMMIRYEIEGYVYEDGTIALNNLNSTRSMYDSEGFNKGGYDREGYNREGKNENGLDRGNTRENGLPGDITEENLSDMSEGELREILSNAQRLFNEAKDNGRLKYSKNTETPLERLINQIEEASESIFSKSSYEFSKDEIEEKFYNEFHTKLFNTMIPEDNREAIQEDLKRFVKALIHSCDDEGIKRINTIFSNVNEKINKIEIEYYINNNQTRIICTDNGEYYSFDKDGWCVKMKKNSDRYEIIDYVKDENGERTLYDPDGFNNKGYDREGYNHSGWSEAGLNRALLKQNGMPGNIKIEQIIGMKDEELKEIFVKAYKYEKDHKHKTNWQFCGKMEKVDKDKEIKEFPFPRETSPIERLLYKIAKVSVCASKNIKLEKFKLNSDEQELDEAIVNEIIVILKDDDIKCGFYEKMYKELFMEDYKGEMSEETHKQIDRVIKTIINIAKDEKIEIKEIVDERMEIENVKYQKRLEEAFEYVDSLEESISSKACDVVCSIDDYLGDDDGERE